ncbi:hypothetical protein DOK76_10675 [Vagococcus sp. DIV0080]|uniref:Uncharacterized protein n=1 Tax=Candidatus Vagococcus giribetii TaxID=2230876 RepID=A0ABS3HV23_9ENTE|nr:hypothetical protein [Vagococcus sp. DIV0080]MBO0477540.1 hypothetical protein [Vagococcus sp. DIV0080]
MKEKIIHFVNEAKKEVDRLEDNREKPLGNSINFIENEIQIQRLLAEIEAYQKVLDLID